MNADRLFMLVDTCANIDEVKHEFPNLDFLTYFYALLDITVFLQSSYIMKQELMKTLLNGILNGKIQLIKR